jgi:homoserine O-acetyltransferase
MAEPQTAKRHDPPESPSSVGWTEARRAVLASEGDPFPLEAGSTIAPVEVEYEVYGELNADRSNAILICHALSGDAHAAGWDRHAEANGQSWRCRKPGWWDAMIGPGKHVDTQRYCVICSNVLGGCYGTTGPSSIDPATGSPYGKRFPVVTVEDWVRLQRRLMDQLGIPRWHAVMGGSLGGQQALEWALAYPEALERCIVLAASPRLSSQGLGFNAVGRHAIIEDPKFAGGDYYGGAAPATGLAAARMLAHITCLSEQGMDHDFGRRLQGKDKPDFGFGIEFEVESYLDYQGRSFVERFDANSYLYITRAMDYYDAAARWGDGDLATACRRIRAATMVASFSTDWLYTPEQCRELAATLCRIGTPVTYVDLPSRFGHDAFLVEIASLGPLLRDFLAAPVTALELRA